MRAIRKLITIVGPTASGKTAVAVQLAKRFDGELVSADSRQVYRGLDIGTAKEGKRSSQLSKLTHRVINTSDLKKCLRYIEGVPQWVIDICEPEDGFTLFDYLPLARMAIKDIFDRNKLPIIVGGTGLYIQGLVEGFDTKNISSAKVELDCPSLVKLRVKELQKILAEIDTETLKGLADPKNPYRLIRAIQRAQEGLLMTKRKPDFETLQIGLMWPRDTINKRIDERIEQRFEQGMLTETKHLLKSGVSLKWLHNLGLEYKLMTSFLISDLNLKPEFRYQNIDSYDQLKNFLKIKSHQYAKRQMTWFKRFPEIVWENKEEKIEKITRDYLVN